MPIALLNRHDFEPSLPAISGFLVRRVRDATLMARLQTRTIEEMEERFDAGHRAYVAYVDDVPAAFGWVATAMATIGELHLAFTVANNERYLWNFVTLREFRGRGIYPRLLEAIVTMEAKDAERFWIAYAPENRASGAGIRNAGFALVADLSFDAHGQPVLKAIAHGGADAAARWLGIAQTAGSVAPCWKCVRHAAPGHAGCAPGHCMCDYQRPERACAD